MYPPLKSTTNQTLTPSKKIWKFLQINLIWAKLPKCYNIIGMHTWPIEEEPQLWTLRETHSMELINVGWVNVVPWYTCGHKTININCKQTPYLNGLTSKLSWDAMVKGKEPKRAKVDISSNYLLVHSLSPPHKERK